MRKQTRGESPVAHLMGPQWVEDLELWPSVTNVYLYEQTDESLLRPTPATEPILEVSMSMDYDLLKSIVRSNKGSIIPDNPSSSFYVATQRDEPYIEPTFEKELFDSERPDVLLISAVGATGKSTLAKELSHDLQLPLLDLGTYEPVGGDTLTGILTDAYSPDHVGDVIQGLSTGSFGTIIDGVDEGKSKTNDEAFRAFLENISRFTKGSEFTSFVMLGRTQSLEDCYLYFLDKNVDVGLITINPFNIESAKTYIDTFTSGTKEDHTEKYLEARDLVVSCIEDAFKHEENEYRFESFIGYPPVLDSISTALDEEQNYVRITNRLGNANEESVEIETLYDVSEHILQREREDKVLPQTVEPLVEDKPADIREPALEDAYSLTNQGARLVAHCLGEEPPVSAIPDPNLNEQYEEAVGQRIEEHPFLDEHEFRNVVFEAVSLSILMTSGKEEHKRLPHRYLKRSKASYHLVYMLDLLSRNENIDKSYISPLISSSLEFRSTKSSIEVRVDGISPEEYKSLEEPDTETEISVNIFDKESNNKNKKFTFETDIKEEEEITLRSPVGSLFMTVPCEVTLSGRTEVEVLAPTDVTSKSLNFEVDNLITRPAPTGSQDKIIFRAHSIDGFLREITKNNSNLSFSLEDFDGIHYPLHQYSEKHSPDVFDPNLKNKYIRLRRILREFASHGKGSLAKYHEKIESSRVLKNEIGERILESLIEDNILYREDKMYFLSTDKLDEYLGVNWHDFRLGKQPDQLMEYLKKID